MNGSTPDQLPPLGRKIEPPKPAEPAPQWKPLRPGYETDGSAVRRVQSQFVSLSSLIAEWDADPEMEEHMANARRDWPNAWAEFMKHYRGSYEP